MLVRTITALVGIPLVLFVLFGSSTIMFFAVLILSAVGNYELMKAFHHLEDVNPLFVTGILGGAVSTWFFLKEDIVTGLFIQFLLLLIHFAIIIFTRKMTVKDLIFTHAAMQISTLLFTFIYYLRILEHGEKLIFLPFVVAWLSDTFAYFFGITMGKNGKRLCPEISPKKSVIGAIGGLVGAMVGMAVYVFLVPMPFPKAGMILCAALLSVVSQIGDLAFSLIKRYCGVKDYSNILPGHGGFLDRFDSVLFVTPVIYGLVVTFFA